MRPRPWALLIASFLLPRPAVRAAGSEGLCGTEPRGADHLLALHHYWRQAGVLGMTATSAPAGSTRVEDRDEGHVAVVLDRGDLVARKNPFDLDGVTVRLSPNAAGGYDPARLSLPLESPGMPVAVGDEGGRAVELPFAFPFFGRRYDRVFLHADGHLTFGASDPETGERSMARFLGGPPRIAVFFTDLDPGRGGTIGVSLSADRAVFRWDAVPGGGQINRNSFQAVLLPGGDLELSYGEMQTREAIVGVSPGATADLTAADFAAGHPRTTGGTLVERFSETEELDLVSVARRFYTGHPDLFAQLVVYTGRPLNPLGGTLAFQVNVRNDIRGIGLEPIDRSAEWGSAGRLESVVFMDSIDPYLEVDGFEILGHEVGHRWLARLRFRAPDGSDSAALLGRGGVHWSFFLDTDASVMEGNDIEDQGGGRFETVDITRGYSALDQYAMGLRAASDVPPFFYVEGADNFRPNRPYKLSTAPEAGVSFTGLRREVRIEDVVTAMGPRVPDASTPRLLHQAYVLVADGAAPATDRRTAAVDRIRSRFEEFYRTATGGRGLVETRLR